MYHSWSVITNLHILQVWAGNPAKFLRKLTDEELAFISQSATNYTNLAQVHAAENSKSFDEIEFEKVLRKKYARKDEEYDSMLGVVREIPPELILPDNVLPNKADKALKKWGLFKSSVFDSNLEMKSRDIFFSLQIHGRGIVFVPNNARHFLG